MIALLKDWIHSSATTLGSIDASFVMLGKVAIRREKDPGSQRFAEETSGGLATLSMVDIVLVFVMLMSVRIDLKSVKIWM